MNIQAGGGRDDDFSGLNRFRRGRRCSVAIGGKSWRPWPRRLRVCGGLGLSSRTQYGATHKTEGKVIAIGRPVTRICVDRSSATVTVSRSDGDFGNRYSV